jgi:hypothetical protein
MAGRVEQAGSKGHEFIRFDLAAARLRPVSLLVSVATVRPRSPPSAHAHGLDHEDTGERP